METMTPEPTASNLNTSINAEWRRRPDDERFLDLDALHTHCLARADRCQTENTLAKRVKPLAMPMITGQQAPEIGGELKEVDRHFGLIFETEAGMVDATHWSFGQLATSIRTPAPYLRRIDTRLAAQLVDYGLGFLIDRDEHSLFLEKDPARGELLRLLAWTSKGYGRIYDHQVVDMVRNVADPDVWKPPVHAYSGEEDSRKATTLYGSDRDVSIFLVDDERPIEISVKGRKETLCRGFLVRNSEVGLTKFKVMMFFYRYLCDNRLIWTPSSMKEIGITHTSGAPERFQREAAPMLERFASADVEGVKARVESAMRLEVGRDKETVTDWLGRHGFGKGEAAKIHDRAVEEEGKARTVWDLINGGTALARGITHTDGRIHQEARFGNLLDRAVA